MTQTPVPMLTIVCIAVSACLSILVPVALLIGCRVRFGRGLKAAAVGALCFFVSVMVLETLLHQVVFSLFPALPFLPAAYVLYGCLASGLFEETARLLGLKWLCRKDPDFVTGLGYGIGHGGFEAVVMVGINLVASLVLVLALNSGADLASGLTQTQIDVFSSTPSTAFLWSGAERLISICLHIALSVLIWMVVTKRISHWFYWVSVGLHALSNAGAALYQCGVWTSLPLTELWTLCTTVLTVALVVFLLKRQPHKEFSA